MATYQSSIRLVWKGSEVMNKKKLRKKLKKMSKRIDELSSHYVDQSWLIRIINDYQMIQGRLFRLEQVYNLPPK